MNDTLDLGLRFVVEPAGSVLSAQEAEQLRMLRPAGIMLRRRNLIQDAPYDQWLAAYSKLLIDVRNAIGRDRIIVSVDHEGGQVHRFPPPITRFPYPALYAAESSAVKAVATAMAEELSSLGINVSFSPSVDIHSNPNNPVINQRAFGTTAEQVIAAAACFAEALRAGGITPCAKHFPGHGDTKTDSHTELPVVDSPLKLLEQREFAPFRALIERNIEMIMSAHIALAQVDPGVPATMSRKIMTDILRKQLGFQGVTIADALGMSGVASHVARKDLATRAHEAGIDLMLMVGDAIGIADAIQAKENLALFCRGATADQGAELEAAQSRISALLQRCAQRTCSKLSERSLENHRKLAESLGKNSQWAHFSFNPAGFT